MSGVTGTKPAVATHIKTPICLCKTVADATVPEVLGTASTTKRFKEIRFAPYKAPKTLNTGVVYIQFLVTNDSPGFVLPNTIGVEKVFTAPEGQFMTLADFFIDVVTNGDGVTYSYIPL